MHACFHSAQVYNHGKLQKYANVQLSHHQRNFLFITQWWKLTYMIRYNVYCI